MTTKGGRRNGAGRPRGAINFDRRALIEAAEAGGEMPIAYMLKVMRDENAPSARRDAMAKAAAAYLHSRLSVVYDDDEAQGAASACEAETPEPPVDNE